jgi:hypothetical protein
VAHFWHTRGTLSAAIGNTRRQRREHFFKGTTSGSGINPPAAIIAVAALVID